MDEIEDRLRFIAMTLGIDGYTKIVVLDAADEIERLWELTDHIESERLMLRAALEEIAKDTTYVERLGRVPTHAAEIARKALT